MTYGSIAWHTPGDLMKTKKRVCTKMAVTQNKCLRIVSGAYRATPIKALEVETAVPPIQLHLDRLQAMARLRMMRSGERGVIEAEKRRTSDKGQGESVGPL